MKITHTTESHIHFSDDFVSHTTIMLTEDVGCLLKGNGYGQFYFNAVDSGQGVEFGW